MYKKLRLTITLVTITFILLGVILLQSLSLRKYEEPSITPESTRQEETITTISSLPGLRSCIGGTGIEVILNCSIPKNLPSKMPLLKVIPNPIPLEKWLKVAREIFNMTGELKLRKKMFFKGALWIRGNKSDLEILNGGYFIWNYRNPKYSSNLPSFNKAKKIADSILSKVKEYGLIPPNLEIKFKSVGYSHWTGVPGNLVPIEISVTYTISYKGYHFGEFIVRITAGPRVIRVSCCKFFEEEKEVPIISAKEALSRILNYTNVKGPISKIIINDIKLAYSNKYGAQKYIEPVYAFIVKLVFPDKSTYDWCIMVPAMKETSINNNE